MDALYALIGVVIVFGGTIIGFFATKKDGFGRYNTSILILILVLFLASVCLVLGKVEWQPLASLLFAVTGYAGGLISGRAGKSSTSEERRDDKR